MSMIEHDDVLLDVLHSYDTQEEATKIAWHVLVIYRSLVRSDGFNICFVL